MNQNQALKIIREAIKPKLAEYAFMASLYEKGHKTAETKRVYLKRQKILDAMRVLEESQFKQLDLFGK